MSLRSPTPLASSVLLLALLALFVGGCGGSHSDKKANETYANGVCTAIGNWAHEVKSIAANFSGGVSKASLQSKVSQIESATKSLASELKAIPPPKTSEGQAAKQQLDQLANDLSNTVASIKAGIDQLSGNASTATVRTVAATVAPQLESLAKQAESALKSLKGSAASWADAFDSASACKGVAP
jgi:hypothetical protein